MDMSKRGVCYRDQCDHQVTDLAICVNHTNWYCSTVCASNDLDLEKSYRIELFDKQVVIPQKDNGDFVPDPVHPDNVTRVWEDADPSYVLNRIQRAIADAVMCIDCEDMNTNNQTDCDHEDCSD